jgi:hypothetical protein
MTRHIVSFVAASLLLTGLGISSLQAQQTTKNKKAKPFLIQGKLPHLTMMVKMLWNDEDLALTPEQKQKLLIIRKETISGAQALGKKIFALEDKIVKASNEGVTPSELKDDVQELANLRAQATMLHLKCIYNTRKILTTDQLYILE